MRSRISIRGCVRPSVRQSVRRSVGHTRVEYLRNGPNLNKIASGIRKNAILKMIQRQVRGQWARTHLLSELCSTCSTEILENFVNESNFTICVWKRKNHVDYSNMAFNPVATVQCTSVYLSVIPFIPSTNFLSIHHFTSFSHLITANHSFFHSFQSPSPFDSRKIIFVGQTKLDALKCHVLISTQQLLILASS